MIIDLIIAFTLQAGAVNDVLSPLNACTRIDLFILRSQVCTYSLTNITHTNNSKSTFDIKHQSYVKFPTAQTSTTKPAVFSVADPLWWKCKQVCADISNRKHDCRIEIRNDAHGSCNDETSW